MLHSFIHIYCAFALFHSHGHKVTKMLRKGRLLWCDQNSCQFLFSFLMKNLLFFHGYSISRFSLSILHFMETFDLIILLYFSSSGILFVVYGVWSWEQVVLYINVSEILLKTNKIPFTSKVRSHLSRDEGILHLRISSSCLSYQGTLGLATTGNSELLFF